MSMCDVRRCPENEVVPLLLRMMCNRKPEDVRWSGSDTYIIYRKDKYKLLVHVFGRSGECSFEFYTGVDNIRFDGNTDDSRIKNIISSHIEHGKGTRVSDFIKLD